MKKILSVLLMLLFAVPVLDPQIVRAQSTTPTPTTNATLQAIINQLLVQLAQLQAQINNQTGQNPTTGTPGYIFTSDLTIGSTGNQVVELQKFLVAKGYLRIPITTNYGYFGVLTRNALSAFQTAQGISPTAGYFGPITRARVNALLATQAPIPPVTGGSSTGITTPGIEGTLSINQTNSGIRSTVYEGDDMVPILGFEAEARTSDIALQRVRVNLGNSSTLYNRILSKLYLTTSDNTVLASADLSQSSVTRESNSYFITLTGFNYVIPKNTKKTLMIKADVRGSIDTADRSSSRTISLSDNGVRGIDGAGIDHYSPISGSAISRSFNVSESLAETATLRLSTNSNTPQTQSVIASSGSNNNEYDRLPVLTFDLRSDRGEVRLTDLAINIEKTGSGSANASSTVYLYEGSNEIDNTSISGNTATFRDLDLTISPNSTKTYSVRIDVRGANNGIATFVASASSTGITAENTFGDRLSTTDISGSATGNSISIRNVGPEITLLSKSITTSGAPQNNGVTTNVSTSTLTATFNVKIRALGSDIVFGLPSSSTPLFASTSQSFKVYKNGVYDSSIGSYATSTSFALPSGVTTSGLTNSFQLGEGNEITLPITVQILGRRPDGTVLPAGLYSIGFEGIAWTSTDGSSGTTSFMAGLQEWRTNDVSFP